MDRPAAGGVRPRRRITTRRLMLAVVAVACGLGWLAGMQRSRRRVEALRALSVARIARIKSENPPLMHVGSGGASWWGWDGYAYRHDQACRTTTGRRISIAVELRASPFGTSGRVEFASGGRSVAWTLADLEGGRPIDLKAEFPDAFR